MKKKSIQKSKTPSQVTDPKLFERLNSSRVWIGMIYKTPDRRTKVKLFLIAFFSSHFNLRPEPGWESRDPLTKFHNDTNTIANGYVNCILLCTIDNLNPLLIFFLVSYVPKWEKTLVHYHHYNKTKKITNFFINTYSQAN